MSMAFGHTTGPRQPLETEWSSIVTGPVDTVDVPGVIAGVTGCVKEISAVMPRVPQ